MDSRIYFFCYCRKGSYNAPSTKIATPATWSLFSWKCAISFVLLTALVSGGLIVAFFIMNIESEINTMKMELTKGKVERFLNSIQKKKMQGFVNHK